MDDQLARNRPSPPLEAARVRGLRAQEAFEAMEGGMLSAVEVAKRLRISVLAVNERQLNGRLLALKLGQQSIGYPAWQLGSRGLLQGFEEILATLAHHDSCMQARFFLTASLRLAGARPLDELRNGNVEAVQAAARVYPEQGAI